VIHDIGNEEILLDIRFGARVAGEVTAVQQQKITREPAAQSIDINLSPGKTAKFMTVSTAVFQETLGIGSVYDVEEVLIPLGTAHQQEYLHQNEQEQRQFSH